MAKNRIKLSPYYIAYLDILGSQEYLKSAKSEEYLNKIKALYDDVLISIKLLDIQKYNIKINTKIFSDNIVIAIKKDVFNTITEDMKILLLANVASYFQMLGFKYDFLVRGTITLGDFYLDNDLVCGKGLVDAYKIESEIAVYPRIIVNNLGINDFIQCNNLKRYLKKDFDGACYLDTFSNYFDIVNGDTHIHEIKVIQQTMTNKINQASDYKIQMKNFWLANKFNEFCQNNGFEECLIDIKTFPYDPNYIRTIVTGGARELENAK